MKEKEKTKSKKQSVKDLEAEVAVLREEIAKKDDYHDTALRLQAEFDNFRKRSAKEKMEFVKYANESLILELVGILDNFERSIKAADQKKDFNLLHQGVDMISKQLHKLLEEKGLKKIKCAGEKFDPVRHEAIEVVETESADEDETVSEELQAGYMLNEKVIRPAMVKVARLKQDTQPQDAEEPEEEPAQYEEEPAQDDIDGQEEEGNGGDIF